MHSSAIAKRPLGKVRMIGLNRFSHMRNGFMTEGRARHVRFEQ